MIQDFLPYAKKPKCDLHLVAQSGWIDLVMANRTGTIDGSANSQPLPSNEISDPKGILGRPSDVFEAYRMMNYVESVSSPTGSQNGSSDEGEAK